MYTMNISRLSGRAVFTVVFSALSSLFFFAKADSVTADFNENLPEGWSIEGTIYRDSDRARSGKGLYSTAKNENNYVVTGEMEGDISFYARTYNTKSNGYVIFYEVNDDNSRGDKITEFATGNYTSSRDLTFRQYTYTLPLPRRLAIVLYFSCIDDFTFTPATKAEGAKLTVQDYDNGSTCDFGGQPVPAATEAVFTLMNAGAADLNISAITVSGGYTLADGADIHLITPGATARVAVATPAADATGILRIESDDAESPYVINLVSSYKEPAPEMTVSATELDFGRITSVESKTVVVGNTGDAPLILKAASSSNFFTVTPENLEVLPGETGSLSVTFEFGEESYGSREATLTLTPNVGDPVEIVCSAFAKDPTIWEEDFEGGVMPEYWSTTGWTVTRNYDGNGTYMAYAGTSSSAHTITTPRLRATAGETLTFEIGRGTDSQDPLNVEFSHDLLSWKPMEGTPLTEAGFHTFTAPEEGYYYFRFNGRYGSIDNFYGFRLALKEHDITVVSSVLPAEANQYLEYEAKITLKEMMGRNEDFIATLLIDGHDADVVEGTIAAGDQLTLTLTYIPVEPADDVKAEVTVSFADEGFLTTDPASVVVKAAPVWDENSTAADFESGNYPVVVLRYSPQPGWNTIAVPFQLDDARLEAIFGEVHDAFELKKFEAGEILFQTPTMFAAGYPYVVYAGEASTESLREDRLIVLKDVDVISATPGFDMVSGLKFTGTFTPWTNDGTETHYSINHDRTLSLIEAGGGIAGFHGYLTLPAGFSTEPTLKFIDLNGVETGVGAVRDLDTHSDAIYTIDGRRVERASAPGLYIIGGRKVLVK